MGYKYCPLTQTDKITFIVDNDDNDDHTVLRHWISTKDEECVEITENIEYIPLKIKSWQKISTWHTWRW